jgi:hypothetical protein
MSDRTRTSAVATSEDTDCATVKALASANHVSIPFVYRLMADEDDPLPSFKLGRRRFIRWSAWRAYCARREAQQLQAQKKGVQAAA